MNEIKTLFEDKTIAILGFGREGRSTYTLIRSLFPEKKIAIFDENEAIREDSLLINDTNINFITGTDSLQFVDKYDIAIKSPGIPSGKLPSGLQKVQITSQTNIFLRCYGKQVIGITGTKGKSTTASLILHILKTCHRDSLLVGNIGIPPFDCINNIQNGTVIVMELSSHQLEFIDHSPHIAILLNIFQEHLDHYHSYKDYQSAKLNIGRFQKKDDYYIYNSDNEILRNEIPGTQTLQQVLLPFSMLTDTKASIRKEDQIIEINLDGKKSKIYDSSQGQNLLGNHNMYNIMAAAAACYICKVPVESIISGIRSFKGLEHRIELVGEYAGISWYNDSIATIPEATMEAIKSLQNVNTLILGGFDRGIEYSELYPFLTNSDVANIIFVGAAGARIREEFITYGAKNIQLLTASDYSEVVSIARNITKSGSICLLSPAAASYDMFKNFEERGNVYKKIVRNLSSSQS